MQRRAVTIQSSWKMALYAVVALCAISRGHAQSAPQSGETQQETGGGPPVSQETEASDPESMLPHLADTRFWRSGQANFIFQTHPPFHAPYSGPNSLRPRYRKATSPVLTFYTGGRLTDSTD